MIGKSLVTVGDAWVSKVKQQDPKGATERGGERCPVMCARSWLRRRQRFIQLGSLKSAPESEHTAGQKRMLPQESCSSPGWKSPAGSSSPAAFNPSRCPTVALLWEQSAPPGLWQGTNQDKESCKGIWSILLTVFPQSGGLFKIWKEKSLRNVGQTVRLKWGRETSKPRKKILIKNQEQQQHTCMKQAWFKTGVRDYHSAARRRCWRNKRKKSREVDFYHRSFGICLLPRQG